MFIKYCVFGKKTEESRDHKNFSLSSIELLVFEQDSY